MEKSVGGCARVLMIAERSFADVGVTTQAGPSQAEDDHDATHKISCMNQKSLRVYANVPSFSALYPSSSGSRVMFEKFCLRRAHVWEGSDNWDVVFVATHAARAADAERKIVRNTPMIERMVLEDLPR